MGQTRKGLQNNKQSSEKLTNFVAFVHQESASCQSGCHSYSCVATRVILLLRRFRLLTILLLRCWRAVTALVAVLLLLGRITTRALVVALLGWRISGTVSRRLRGITAAAAGELVRPLSSLSIDENPSAGLLIPLCYPWLRWVWSVVVVVRLGWITAVLRLSVRLLLSIGGLAIRLLVIRRLTVAAALVLALTLTLTLVGELFHKIVEETHGSYKSLSCCNKSLSRWAKAWLAEVSTLIRHKKEKTTSQEAGLRRS